MEKMFKKTGKPEKTGKKCLTFLLNCDKIVVPLKSLAIGKNSGFSQDRPVRWCALFSEQATYVSGKPKKGGQTEGGVMLQLLQQKNISVKREVPL